MALQVESLLIKTSVGHIQKLVPSLIDFVQISIVISSSKSLVDLALLVSA